MKKYVSKPVVIEAMQWFKPGDHDAVKYVGSDAFCSRRYMIKTANDWVVVHKGDWIIKEPETNGHYPCKPDVFALKYEEVKPLEPLPMDTHILKQLPMESNR